MSSHAQTISELDNQSSFTFDKLSEEAKATALEKHRDWNVDCFEWWDGVYEQWQERLEELGYNNVEIQFSGFWCQGDGASFTADIDLVKWLLKHDLAGIIARARFSQDFEVLTDNIWVSLQRTNSYYTHENTVGSSWEINVAFNNSTLEKEVEDILDNHILDVSRGYMQDIYKDLEAEYYYLTSDEIIAESLMANELQFDEDGNSL